MTLDDDLVESVDEIVHEPKTTRSAFTREALADAIHHFNMRLLEAKHGKGDELHLRAER